MVRGGGIQALVIRSLPDEGKAMRNYGERPAAYLTHEAVELIVKRIDHLGPRSAQPRSL